MLLAAAGLFLGRIIDARLVKNDLAAARLEAERHVNQMIEIGPSPPLAGRAARTGA